MKWTNRKTRRRQAVGFGMEVGAALSAASRMALLYPPGCDEWIRRELAGEGELTRRSGQDQARARGS